MGGGRIITIRTTRQRNQIHGAKDNQETLGIRKGRQNITRTKKKNKIKKKKRKRVSKNNNNEYKIKNKQGSNKRTQQHKQRKENIITRSIIRGRRNATLKDEA